MQKVLLLLFFFLLNGCSLNNALLTDEVDTVYIVKHDPYVLYNRAYFTRGNLQPILNGQKYLYFHNSKKEDLTILLHRKKQYLIYSLSYPDKKELLFNTNNKHNVFKYLKEKEYHRTTPEKVGYTVNVSPRIYKGIKTFLVEVTDYSRLQKVYKNAISTYNAKAIINIKAKLPKVFISDYYKQYYKRAKTQKQLKQLQIIGKKLGLYSAPAVAKTTKENVKEDAKEIPEKSLDEERVKKEEIKKPKVEKEVNSAEVIQPPNKATKPYSYYLNTASYDELNTYLSKSESRDHLTYNQHNTLKEKLKEEKVLRDGSLEEVIAAYKKNKDPRYKARSLQLMKKAQENK